MFLESKYSLWYIERDERMNKDFKIDKQGKQNGFNQAFRKRKICNIT